VLSNSLRMNAHGPAIITWPLLYEPLHNALMEDSMARAQEALGMRPETKPWSAWVRFLRWSFSGGKARSKKQPVERF
jgi:hypothetical protein